MTSWMHNTEMVNYLKDLLGAEYLSFAGESAESPAVRVNTLKTTVESFTNFLEQSGQEYTRIPFTATGYVLADDRLPLSHTLKFFTGHFQYQGISSQLPAILLDVHPGENVLDMAAAPGSKSSQLSGLMHNRGALVLNDVHRGRHQPLNVNMQRCGAVNYYVLNAWGERMGAFFPEYFDKILVDAPCSALGTLHSNPGIAAWWSVERMFKLSRVQYQLLVSAVKALRVGGELVYSTCSITPEENEMVIHRLLSEYPMQVVAIPGTLRGLFDTGRTEYKNEKFNPQLKNAIRVWPQRHHMEGFFAVRLVKQAPLKKSKDTVRPECIHTRAADDADITPVLADLQKNWGIATDTWSDYRFVLTSTRLWLVQEAIRQVIQSRFVFAGLLLAEKRLFGWKLLNGSAQVFSERITGRRIRADAELLKVLFKTGRIPAPGIADGYYALDYNNEIIACVFIENCEMRISLPHYFNLIVA
jgi:16S rRNA (cytosine1407-C5)-methyltransferase